MVEKITTPTVRLNPDGTMPITTDGRVKIPVNFAYFMTNAKTGEAYNTSTIVRYNQGTRDLSIDAAIQVIDLFEVAGYWVHITDILPDLAKVRGYLCQSLKP